MSSSSIAERVRKLLNQAENTDNEAEAAVFMAKAQELSTLHSIDLAKARHITIAKEKTVPVTKRVQLGKRGVRGLNTYVELIGGIAGANDVEYNIAHNRTYVNLFGFAEDIEVVEALYTSLQVQMVAASQAFKKTGDWKLDTVYRPYFTEYFYIATGKKATKRAYEMDSWRNPTIDERYVGGDYVPVPWLSARLDFQQAFAERIGMRLRAAQREAEAKAMAEEILADTESAGTELVLFEKKKEVAAFYKATSTARGSYRGGRNSVVSSGARAAGDSAGRTARLSNASSLPGARKAIA